VLEDGIIKDGNFTSSRAPGCAPIAGEKTGFAYSDELQFPALEQAAEAARAIAGGGREGRSPDRGAAGQALYEPLNPIDSMDDAAKVELLHQVDAEARRADPRVTQVVTSLVAVQDTILVIADDGRMSADVRPLIRLSVSVVVEQDGRREQATAAAARAGSWLLPGAGPRPRLRPRGGAPGPGQPGGRTPAPAGTMTVVLGAGWPGVLLHEAIGHGLEGDFNRKGTSAFAGRIGERVAARASPWSTTAPCPAGAARSTSTTRARRPSARR
jgi:TldD protein